MIDLLQGASAEQAAFVLAKPREALASVRGMPTALRDPRLSRAGNWLARHLSKHWKRWCVWRTGCGRRTNANCVGRIERFCNRCWLRVGDQSSVVAELVLGPDLKRGRRS